jgi:hypothetical protein
VLRDGTRMSRFHEIGFSTAWNPPEVWLSRFAEQQGEIGVVLSYDDGGGGFGVLSADLDEDLDSWVQVRRRTAEVVKDRLSPAARREPVLRAIDRGDMAALDRWISRAGRRLDAHLACGWTALMHAARHPAPGAFRRLLEAGANPRVKGANGLSVMDLLLDVYSNDAPRMSAARIAMTRRALRVCPDLADEPLLNGGSPLRFAIGWGIPRVMGELLSVVLRTDQSAAVVEISRAVARSQPEASVYRTELLFSLSDDDLRIVMDRVLSSMAGSPRLIELAESVATRYRPDAQMLDCVRGAGPRLDVDVRGRRTHSSAPVPAIEPRDKAMLDAWASRVALRDMVDRARLERARRSPPTPAPEARP